MGTANLHSICGWDALEVRVEGGGDDMSRHLKLFMFADFPRNYYSKHKNINAFQQSVANSNDTSDMDALRGVDHFNRNVDFDSIKLGFDDYRLRFSH